MLVMKKLITAEGNLCTQEFFRAVDAYCAEKGILGITHEVVLPSEKIVAADAVAIFDGYVFCIRPAQDVTQAWALGVPEAVMLPSSASEEEIAGLVAELMGLVLMGESVEATRPEPPRRLFD